MNKMIGGATLAVAAVAVAIPASAAVKPQSGHYRMAQPNDPSADVLSFELKGTKLYSLSHFDKCATDLISGRFVTTVKGGKFSFHKTLKANPAAYKIDLTGKFTSATSAKGTITYKKTKGSPTGKAGCKSTTKFTVKRNGPPRPPNLADR